MEKISILNILKDTWKIFFANFWNILGAGAATVLIGASVAYLPTLLNIYTGPVIYIIEGLKYAVSSLLGFWWIWFSLSLVRNWDLNMSNFWPTLNRFGKYFLSEILFSISVILGLMLLIFPGVWIMMSFGFFPFIIMDNDNLTIKKSFQKSLSLTKGNIVNIATIIIITLTLNLLGFMAYKIGFTVTLGFTAVILATTYEHLRKKSTFKEEPVKEVNPLLPVTPFPTNPGMASSLATDKKPF